MSKVANYGLIILTRALGSHQIIILFKFAILSCRCNNFYMDSKVPLLYPFKYVDRKPKMSTYLKRQCLFDVSIGAMSELESYKEKIVWIND